MLGFTPVIWLGLGTVGVDTGPYAVGHTICDLTLANSLPCVIQFCCRDKGVDRKSEETGLG